MFKCLFVLILCCSCSTNYLFIRNQYGKPTILCSKNNLYVMSDNLHGKYYTAVNEAAEYWNKAIGRRVFILGGTVDFGPDDVENPVMIIVGLTKYPEDLPENALALAHLRIGAYGCTIGATVKIKEMGDIDAVILQNIMNHEFGHILGANHSLFKEDLMYKYISTDTGSLNYYPWLKHPDSRLIEYLREFYR